jgi:hypothetical protein
MFGFRIPTISQLVGGGSNKKKASAPAAAPAPAAPAAASAAAATPRPPSRRFSYDEPATYDFADPNNPKKNNHRRTLLAGDTGGYNPATSGNSSLGGMRSLLG